MQSNGGKGDIEQQQPEEQNKFIRMVIKLRIPLILISVGATLFGMNVRGAFPMISIPGILLGAMVLLVSLSEWRKTVTLNSVIPNLRNVKNNEANTQASKDNAADELIKWHELKERGVITDEEFEAKKKQLLT